MSGSSAVVVVDVPGITRAYHDLDIKAKRARRLTIPMHRQAYGLPASAFEDLFYLKTKSGAETLAKNEGGALVFMYLLKEKVHQAKDPRLMPSDQTIVANVAARIWAYLQRSR